VIDGLFQSLAVRASGFAIVSIESLAPAVQWVTSHVLVIEMSQR
jgi:hypothetical protein